MAPGTYSYLLGGDVKATDLAGGLTGSVTIDSSGIGYITVTAVADNVTDGDENMTITIGGKTSATVVRVLDTSKTPVASAKTMPLTIGANAGADFTGTAANDTYDASLGGASANLQTLGSQDTLNGGDGVDQLFATLNTSGPVTPSLTSVETLTVTAVTTPATISLASSSGYTTLENSGSSVGLTFSNIASTAPALRDTNNSSGTTFSYVAAAVAATSGDTATLTLSNVTGGTESVSGIEILNLVSTSSANTVTTLTDSSLQTLNITGTVDFTLTNATPAATSNVNAADFTGKLSLTGANATAMTITGGSAADTLTGGAGNDNLVGNAGADSLTGGNGDDVISGGTGADTLVGGAGNDNLSGGDDNDTLVFASASELAGDGTVSGGAGTDTIRFTGAANAGDVGADITEASLVNSRISSIEAIDFRGLSEDVRTLTLTDAVMTAMGTATFTVTDGQYDATASTGGLILAAGSLTAANSIDATLNNRSVGLVTISTGAGATTDTLTFAVGGTTYATYTAASATETVTTSATNLAAAINAVAAGTYVATSDAGVVAITTANPGSAMPTNTLTSAGSFRLTVGGVANAAAGASTVPLVGMDNNYTGGAGADTFRVSSVGGGLTSSDTLNGGLGVDTVIVTGGASTATGINMTNVTNIETIQTSGTGLVTINNFAAATIAATGTLTVNAASQTNATLGLNLDASGNTNAGKLSVTGGAGSDTIVGSSGADTIIGGAGNDGITPGAGNDSVDGGTGDDTITYATELAFSDDTGLTVVSDTVIGGAGGNDILDFTGGTSTLTAAQMANVSGFEVINFGTTGSSLVLTDAIVAANGGTTQNVRVTDASTITASALTAASSLAVRVENAVGSGVISVTGGAGNDTVQFSGATNGVLSATDAVRLGAGTNDQIIVTNVAGHASGTGSASAATLSSLVTGVETLTILDLATDQALGDVSITLDSSFTMSGVFTVDGTQLDAGEDLTFSNSANSNTSGTSVAARVSVTGGAGADAITGGVLADTLIGGDGDDQITGGAGIDSLVGGNGSDTFVVGTLADFAGLLSPETIVGGAQNATGAGDTLSVTAAGTINATDLAAISGIETISLASTGTQTVFLSDTVYTANGATTLAIVEAGTSTISVNAAGLSAVNSVQVTTRNAAVNETIIGGAGNDTFTATIGNTGTVASTDTFTGNAGQDTLVLSTTATGNTVDLTGVTGIETIRSAVGTGGATTDTITFAAIPDTLVAAGQTLTLNLSDRTGSVVMNATNNEADGSFNITTGSAADTIYGGALADTIDGGAGSDTIVGNAGADSLTGNAGDDTLNGGAGADTLTGGTGNDYFQFTTVAGSSGSTLDTITDFASGGGATANTDRIEITLNYSTLAAGLTINANRAAAGQAGLTDAQAALSGDRGQFIYDTTNSRLYVNVNNDNLITSQDYSINVNPASTAANTIGVSDISFVITGGTGADAITSGASFDTILGGAGDDVLYYGGNNSPAGEVISGGAGTDTLWISSNNTFVAANFGTTNATNTVNTAGLIENIVITSGATATFLGTQLTAQTINVNATTTAAATLAVSATAATDLSGLTFTSTNGQDAFNTGVDRITVTIAAAGGFATVGSSIADSITGGAGIDSIANQAAGSAGTAADTLAGGDGADTFILRGAVVSGVPATVVATVPNITDFVPGTDILALSNTVASYTGAVGTLIGGGAAAAGVSVITSIATATGTAVATDATADLIKLTTGLATGASIQAMFNTAIGTNTVTGYAAASSIFVTIYDTTLSQMDILVANVAGGAGATTLETGDVVSLVGTVNMTAAQYLAFASASFAIIA